MPQRKAKRMGQKKKKNEKEAKAQQQHEKQNEIIKNGNCINSFWKQRI